MPLGEQAHLSPAMSMVQIRIRQKAWRRMRFSPLDIDRMWAWKQFPILGAASPKLKQLARQIWVPQWSFRLNVDALNHSGRQVHCDWGQTQVHGCRLP